VPLPGLGPLIGLVALLIIGALIIVFVGLLILFIPAAVLSILVWLVTGRGLLAGAAFLLVALLALLRKLF